MRGISTETKRRISVIAAILILSSAAFIFNLEKAERDTFTESDGKYYELVESYMKSEYIDAYADYFEMIYVERLSDYKEKISRRSKKLEAEFLMNTYYKYHYKDPDTVASIIKARENGDMTKYKELYDEYNKNHNEPQSADYRLRLEARLENDVLNDVVLFSGTDDGGWIRLENGLRDYIIED